MNTKNPVQSFGHFPFPGSPSQGMSPMEGGKRAWWGWFPPFLLTQSPLLIFCLAWIFIRSSQLMLSVHAPHSYLLGRPMITEGSPSSQNGSQVAVPKGGRQGRKATGTVGRGRKEAVEAEGSVFFLKKKDSQEPPWTNELICLLLYWSNGISSN